MSTPDTRKPAWALGLGTGVLLILALAGLAFVGGRSLPERTGPPIEEIGVERVVLQPGSIELGIRNTGADPISIGQIFVNDAYVDFTGPVERSDDCGPRSSAWTTPGRTVSPTRSRC
ncbi:hypothetical protein [Nocardia fluminea]|uniref:Uncharacterized protein n=1 Tax=Nocardia fluminea TaxID=134984 RepID=A0A2N3V656_9NOCA|nr:hypothetical protein [Nocardia fluminea]PKV77114.1 hypothetical protein ATK86_1436 [Nocardia fluminea]